MLIKRNLIKKSNFPRVCLPAIVTLSALINFGIVFVLYLVFLLLINHWPGWVLFAVIPLLAIQVFFALGLGVFLGTLNVFFRDVGQLTGIVMQFWFWLTPVVYVFESLPDAVREILKYNPLQPLMLAYQGIFLDQRVPDFLSLIPLLLLTIVLLGLGAKFFLSRVGELVDEL